MVHTCRLLYMIISYDGGSEVIESLCYCIAKMPEPVQNNVEAPLGDAMDQGQGSSNQALYSVPPNFGRIPQFPSELPKNIGNPNHWPTFIVELMKRIPPVPTKNPPRDDKLADRVA